MVRSTFRLGRTHTLYRGRSQHQLHRIGDRAISESFGGHVVSAVKAKRIVSGGGLNIKFGDFTFLGS